MFRQFQSRCGAGRDVRTSRSSYDGSNDLNAQLGPIRGEPTTTNVQELSDLFQARTASRSEPAETSTAGSSDSSVRGLLRQLGAKYKDRSALRRLLGGTAAGATPNAVGAPAPPPIQAPTEAEVSKVIRATLDVYSRGRQLIDAIATRRGVQPIYFVERQITTLTPAGAPKAEFARYRQVLDALADAGPGVVDVAGVLDDHQDTYIDPGHTNEEGAKLIAKAMFDHIEPRLRAWYRSNH